MATRRTPPRRKWTISSTRCYALPGSAGFRGNPALPPLVFNGQPIFSYPKRGQPTMNKAWAVYQVGFGEGQPALRAVCEEREWEVLARVRAGSNRLIQAGIRSEAEAE